MPTTKAPGHRKAWTYTDDLGHVWRFGVKAVYVPPGAARGLLGGATASPTIPRLPQGFRMRAQLGRERGGTRMFWIPAYSPTATWWVNPTTMTWCANGQDVTVDGVPGRRRPEKRPRDASREQS
jgi:hypothetical protein